MHICSGCTGLRCEGSVHTNGIVFQHTQRPVRARPHERPVVACHGHRDKAHHYRTGFCCLRALVSMSCKNGSGSKDGSMSALQGNWEGPEAERIKLEGGMSRIYLSSPSLAWHEALWLRGGVSKVLGKVFEDAAQFGLSSVRNVGANQSEVTPLWLHIQ